MFKEVFEGQREYFRSGKTYDIEVRKSIIKVVRKKIIDQESRILEALKLDLNKSEQEAYITEILPVMNEIDYTLKHLSKWGRKKRLKGTLFSPFSSYYTIAEPKGQVLVVSPFNYPFQLTLIPLVSALAAGNTVILKVSEISSHTGRLLVELFGALFSEELVFCTDVDPSGFDDLFELPYNHVFFTGSTRIGREIYCLGARYLSSMTLELGGKSPAIVHRSANLKLAARKIVWGKFLNAGQTCIAPDYLLVDRSVRAEFLNLLIEEIKSQLNSALDNEAYGKIVSEKHFWRLVGLLEREKVFYGGGHDESTLKIEPTLVEDISHNSRLLSEEIFGPVLPVLYFDDDGDGDALGNKVLDVVGRNPEPLALYVFSEDRFFVDFVVNRVRAGGCCVNDVLVHLLSVDVPFGGRGSSGLGSYHGVHGFLAFSHVKSVCRTPGWFDLSMRYERGSLSKFVKLLKKFKGW
ncbi:MAG: aldehyde dehydrogenase (NAD+) [Fusobacteria bacterium]|nr:MAG: aldehyde dehydrogenase (NAD+) [Fusobacteriota bacterium]KAF0229238.1 MAG: aldehyde dehydrogenase [Fusobacteriota bacterium]